MSKMHYETIGKLIYGTSRLHFHFDLLLVWMRRQMGDADDSRDISHAQALAIGEAFFSGHADLAQDHDDFQNLNDEIRALMALSSQLPPTDTEKFVHAGLARLEAARGKLSSLSEQLGHEEPSH